MLDQRLRLLQIGGLEALGEPVIDRREQFTHLGALPSPRCITSAAYAFFSASRGDFRTTAGRRR
jgi:hypothetical protein